VHIQEKPTNRYGPFQGNAKGINMPRRTVEELDAYSVIDPEIEAIVKSGKLPKPSIDYTDSTKAIQQLRVLSEARGELKDREGVNTTHSSYRTRDGHENRLLIFRPSNSTIDDKLPCIIHLHGGGGAIGSPESTAPFCQELALQQGAVVIAPAYRLAPEHKHPTGRNDCADAVKHIAANAAACGADPTLGFVVGGHSFGGSTAAIISLQAADQGLSDTITGLYLGTGNFVNKQVPAEYTDQYRSRTDDRCTNAPVLDAATKRAFERAGAYTDKPVWGGVSDDDLPNAFKRQPRTYFQVCGMDVLRDDALVYEDMLRSHGVDTRVDIYPGTPHVFWAVFPPGTVSQATKWAGDTQVGMTWLLRR